MAAQPISAHALPSGIAGERLTNGVRSASVAGMKTQLNTGGAAAGVVQPEPSAVLLSGVRKGVMKFEEIVQQISQQAGASVGVGVLVEYPLSRPRHTVHGSLLDKRGRKYAAPYNVRKVSVALLVGGHQRRTTIA